MYHRRQKNFLSHPRPKFDTMDTLRFPLPALYSLFVTFRKGERSCERNFFLR
jgi:hypothetical protein